MFYQNTHNLQKPHIHTHPHITKPTHTHPHITKQIKTTTIQGKKITVQDIGYPNEIVTIQSSMFSIKSP